MFARILFAIVITFAVRVQAAEYGALLGGHMTGAEVDGAYAGGGAGDRFGVKVGLLMTYALGAEYAFRTGTVYDQRHFAVTSADGNAATAMYEYIDVPALLHYAVTDRFGVFAGALLAINIRDKLEIPHAIDRVDPNINGLIPLLEVGVRGKLVGAWSLEAYYERGFTRISDNIRNYTGYGLDAIFSF